MFYFVYCVKFCRNTNRLLAGWQKVETHGEPHMPGSRRAFVVQHCAESTRFEECKYARDFAVLYIHKDLCGPWPGHRWDYTHRQEQRTHTFKLHIMETYYVIHICMYSYVTSRVCGMWMSPERSSESHSANQNSKMAIIVGARVCWIGDNASQIG